MFLGPVFPSPFSDLFAIITPNYRVALKDDFCSKLERRLWNCVEAYGSEKSKEKCLELFYDAYECRQHKIQNERVAEIQKERKRKYKAGEIDELRSEKPPHESFFYR